MKHWKLIFPFTTSKEIPNDVSLRLSKHAFDSLKDGQHKASGFELLTETDRFIKSDNRHLFHYVEQTRKADIMTVRNIYQERLKKVIDEGREITEETREAVKEVAEREALKFGKINQLSVYILYDLPAGRVWCAGSTVKKCEAALKRLRKVLGSLDTEPMVLPLAGRKLAKLLRQGSRWLGDTLAIPEYAKVIAVEREGDSRVTLDGICLLDEHVGEVLSEMQLRTTEMELHKPSASRSPDNQLAWFILDVPDSAGLSLRGLDFASGQAGHEDDAEQSHAADMQIVAKTCEQILAGLKLFTHGEEA